MKELAFHQSNRIRCSLCRPSAQCRFRLATCNCLLLPFGKTTANNITNKTYPQDVH